MPWRHTMIRATAAATAAVITFVFVMAGAMAQNGPRNAPPRSMAVPVPAVAVPGAFIVLSYHEARDDVRDYPDPYAVDAAALVAQFSWLRANDYTPVSLDAIIAARQGGAPLPAKAVLLTFDDGYLSFHTHVYPLLREFRFPALLAVVGKWIDNPPGVVLTPGTTTGYGEKGSVPEASFPSWGELREMVASGLVEIASHTYDLHYGVPANPQGNLQPAASARVYDAGTGRYEDDAAWRLRVRDDLAQNSRVIERETGRRPRAVVWPYGSYNDELLRMAGDLGMSVAFTLDDGVNTPDVPLTALRRRLIEHDPALADFALEVRGPQFPEPLRVVQLSLEAVYNADPVLQERNLSLLLNRINVLKPTHVFLQAATDLDGDGIVDTAYFPNRHLPMRADLFNRVAWQLSSRVDTKVFAVLPMRDERLTGVSGVRPTGKSALLTPAEIAEVYGDLARYANFDGILLMQDGPPAQGDAARFVEGTRTRIEAVRRWRGPMQIARGFFGSRAAASEEDATAVREVAVLAAVTNDLVVVDASRATGASGKPPAANIIYMAGWNTGAEPAAGARLTRRMREMQLGGILNFGYGGDDFLHDDPPLAQVAPAMSLRIHPQ